MNEFEFIADCLANLAGSEGLDLKDDVAIWSPPPSKDAVISMDTLVEGVHFPNGKFDAELAQKLMRVNISDIIAKGAAPVGYILSLALPNWVGMENLKQFSEGLRADQSQYGLKLWGGDTTRIDGPAVLTITIIGTSPIGQSVQRKGAQVGDVLCVTGTIGDSYLGLRCMLGGVNKARYTTALWEEAYHVPKPPFYLQQTILSNASATIDVSDGLIADAQHLAKASNVAFHINLEDIPLSQPTQAWLESQPDRVQALLALAAGGDDYQVLMCLSRVRYERIIESGITITKIGNVLSGEGVQCFDAHSDLVTIKRAGYTHF